MSKNSIKVALYGGSFNPVTHAHIQVVLFLLDTLNMGEVWVLPCGEHRFKKKLGLFQKRLNWCEEVFLNNPQVKVKDLDQFGNGETIHLLNSLKSKFKNDFFKNEFVFYLVIGQDNADEIDSWFNWETLIQDNPFIVFPRQTLLSSSKKWYHSLPHHFVETWKSIDISSTKIRNSIQKNKLEEVQKYLPLCIQKSVIDYFKR